MLRFLVPMRFVRASLPHLRAPRLRGAGRAAVATLGLGVLALVPGRADADLITFTDKDGTVHFETRHKSDHHGTHGRSKGASTAERASSAATNAPSDRSADRFTRYDDWIRQASALYQIPQELIRAVIKCESDYDPRAVSPTGAQGLMQLMPETAMRMQVRDAFDPRENIFGGTRYLRVLANTFSGDLELTIAGYNAGEGAVMRHGGIPPFAETQTYVVNVLSSYRRYRATPDATTASVGP